MMKLAPPYHGASSAILIIALLSIASGFSTNNIHLISRRRDHHSTTCSLLHSAPSSNSDGIQQQQHSAEEEGNVQHYFSFTSSNPSNNLQIINRRKWLASQILASSIFTCAANANAEGSDTDTSTATKQVSSRIVPRNKSVIVIGANGGTGRECVSAVLASGRSCIAATRSGMFNYDEEGESLELLLQRSNPNLHESQADVTDLNSLLSMVVDNSNNNNKEEIGAMIFAASASVKGKTPGVNDAYTVDYQGVINAAQCCIQRNIPRLIVVSSGAVTRPNSPVYKLLNFVGGGIMEAKVRGEDGARELYREDGARRKGLGYTIVRPGGLTSDPIPLGPSHLEVNQGDDKSGRLSRADVAGICVACLEEGSTFDATFECYESNTAKPVENVGLSNILKSTDATSYKSGREWTGGTWDGLLGGLKSDF
mmetsp:Transcript_17426/g.32659  ORF Transcript_17426/g.32659 Transcript_17426/m.32659 type:complete len:425 (-) Transcript_17426:127-1401(-)